MQTKVEKMLTEAKFKKRPTMIVRVKKWPIMANFSIKQRADNSIMDKKVANNSYEVKQLSRGAKVKEQPTEP